MLWFSTYIGQIEFFILECGFDESRSHAEHQSRLDKVRGQGGKVLVVLVYEFQILWVLDRNANYDLNLN